MHDNNNRKITDGYYVCYRLFPHVSKIAVETITMTKVHTDPVSALQEPCMARRERAPEYHNWMPEIDGSHTMDRSLMGHMDDFFSDHNIVP